LSSVLADGFVEVPKPMKDGLPDPNGSLSAKVPSQAIKQANHEVRKLLYKQN